MLEVLDTRVLFRRSLRSAAFVGVIVSALATSGLGAQETSFSGTLFSGSSASSESRLVPNPNAEAVFLAVYFLGSSSNERWDYLYYGDGRVMIDRYADPRAPAPHKSWTSQLVASDMATLLSGILEARLYEFDMAAARERERRLGVTRGLYEDAGVVTFRISLVELDPDSGEVLRTVDHGFTVPGGLFMPWGNGELPEYEALRRVTRFGSEVRSRAIEVQR